MGDDFIVKRSEAYLEPLKMSFGSEQAGRKQRRDPDLKRAVRVRTITQKVERG
ncbi:MAG: hypothetical protein JWM21_3929 [Acidobacteria bacterium]|nr:hypothetical protein [Acidobacteriota bacterium]